MIGDYAGESGKTRGKRCDLVLQIFQTFPDFFRLFQTFSDFFRLFQTIFRLFLTIKFLKCRKIGRICSGIMRGSQGRRGEDVATSLTRLFQTLSDFFRLFQTFSDFFRPFSDHFQTVFDDKIFEMPKDRPNMFRDYAGESGKTRGRRCDLVNQTFSDFFRLFQTFFETLSTILGGPKNRFFKDKTYTSGLFGAKP